MKITNTTTIAAVDAGPISGPEHAAHDLHDVRRRLDDLHLRDLGRAGVPGAVFCSSSRQLLDRLDAALEAAAGRARRPLDLRQQVLAVRRQRFDQAEELVRDRVHQRTEERERDQGRQPRRGRPVRASSLRSGRPAAPAGRPAAAPGRPESAHRPRSAARRSRRRSRRTSSRSAVRRVGPGSWRRVEGADRGCRANRSDAPWTTSRSEHGALGRAVSRHAARATEDGLR